MAHASLEIGFASRTPIGSVEELNFAAPNARVLGLFCSQYQNSTARDVRDSARLYLESMVRAAGFLTFIHNQPNVILNYLNELLSDRATDENLDERLVIASLVQVSLPEDDQPLIAHFSHIGTDGLFVRRAGTTAILQPVLSETSRGRRPLKALGASALTNIGPPSCGTLRFNQGDRLATTIALTQMYSEKGMEGISQTLNHVDSAEAAAQALAGLGNLASQAAALVLDYRQPQ